MKEFEEEEQNGVWQWFGATSELVEEARTAVLEIRSTVFLRSGDALHLAGAKEHGFQEVYTNDRHMLKAARHFPPEGRERARLQWLKNSTPPKSVDGWWTAEGRP